MQCREGKYVVVMQLIALVVVVLVVTATTRRLFAWSELELIRWRQ
jgi:hypothetical protein